MNIYITYSNKKIVSEVIEPKDCTIINVKSIIRVLGFSNRSIINPSTTYIINHQVQRKLKLAINKKKDIIYRIVDIDETAIENMKLFFEQNKKEDVYFCYYLIDIDWKYRSVHHLFDHIIV